MRPEELDELERIAKAATEGPWTEEHGDHTHRFVRIEAANELTIFYKYGAGTAKAADQDERDAAFIATFNPDRVLALLSLLRDKERGSSNASRAATRDHSLAAPDAEPSAVTGVEYPATAARSYAPGLERWAENQRPKTADHKDARLYRYVGTDLYQWYSRRNDSPFSDPCDEPFLIARKAASPTPEHGGRGAPGGTKPTPSPPWAIGSRDNGNAKRYGWLAYFVGRGREACPFPPASNDLQRAYREGWDAAQLSASLGGGEGSSNSSRTNSGGTPRLRVDEAKSEGQCKSEEG